MTDLTPEQVEQWAGDGIAEHHLAGALQVAMPYADGRPGIYWQVCLHAHAKMLQQQATIERLTNLIEEHNREMREMCGHDPMCIKCRAVGKKCPGCTRYYMIDTQDGVK